MTEKKRGVGTAACRRTGYPLEVGPVLIRTQSQSPVTHSLSSPGSYLVMPYMFTDLSKVRSQLSEEKVQFLVYQMLCGLRVSGAATKQEAALSA